MTRISLKEAYDNRDVIAWLVKHQDAIDEMMNILQNINPDGDLTNIVLKTGDQIIDGRKTFIGEIVAECDIIQNGAAYETHAEQIFSRNDYIVMRDGALNGLPAGSYSGLQVKKYNGSDDVRMVVDNTGIMRVGDINDERPLLVRDEAANLTDKQLLQWDNADQKAIGVSIDSAPVSASDSPVSSGGVYTALEQTFGRNRIKGSDYASYSDFYNAIITHEGELFVWTYFNSSGGDYVSLSGAGRSFSTFGMAGTTFISSAYYISQRIQVGPSNITLFTINSGWTETAFVLDYTKVNVYTVR